MTRMSCDMTKPFAITVMCIITSFPLYIHQIKEIDCPRELSSICKDNA